MTDPSQERLTLRFHAISRALAALVAAAGVGVLAARVLTWAVGRPRLFLLESFEANTALAFVLGGFAAWLGQTSWRRRPAVSALGALVAVIGALVLVDPFVTANLSIDGLLADSGRLPTEALVAVSAGIGLCLLGVALTLFGVAHQRSQGLAQGLALMALLLALLAGVDTLYGIGPFGRPVFNPPLPTSLVLALAALATALLLAHCERGWMVVTTSDTAGGSLVRVQPFIASAVLVVVGWLILIGQRAGLYTGGRGAALIVTSGLTTFTLVIVWIAQALDRADTRRKQAEADAQARARQQASVARLGREALSKLDFGTLLDEAVATVARTLEVPYGGVWEFRPLDRAFVLRTAAGWRHDHADELAATRENDSPIGYTLDCKEPVVVEELAQDSRFKAPALFSEYGVVSGLSVVIQGHGTAFGVLGAYATDRRTFSKDDILFLQAVATMLAVAIERQRADEALQLSEEKFATAFRSYPDSIAVTTLTNGRFVDVNHSFLRLTGYTRDEVLGRTADDLALWAEPDSSTLASQAALHGTLSDREVAVRTKQGDVRVGVLSGEVVTLAGEPCFVAVLRDISEHKQAQEVARQPNEKLEGWVSELERRTREITLLNEMGDLLQTCLTADEACAVIVQFAQRLFPSDSGALYMLSASNNLVEAIATWGSVPPAELVFAPDACWALRRGRVHVVTEVSAGTVCHHLEGPVSTPYLCVPMMAQGEALGMLHLREAVGERQLGGAADQALEGKRRLAVTVAEHIGLALANLKLRETLRTQSIRDPLTGLFNRRYMEESVERELRRAVRKQCPLGAIILDLDHFKHINDTYGHDAGDEMLRSVGQFLQKRARAEDIVCRYGGEEFLFILPEASLRVTRQRADQLRQDIKTLRVSYQSLTLDPVSLSLGVAAFPDHGATVEALLRAADMALYRAKAEGRDRVMVGQTGTE